MAAVLDVSLQDVESNKTSSDFTYSSTVNEWQGFVRVDGVAYNWMGAHPGPDLVNQSDLTYTSTRSIFTFNVAGTVNMVVEFLSPVFPDDLQRQSITSSYVQVSASASDGQAHQVQIYADVSGGQATTRGDWRPCC